MDHKFAEVAQEYKEVSEDLEEKEAKYSDMIDHTPTLVHVMKDTKLKHGLLSCLDLSLGYSTSTIRVSATIDSALFE